MTDLRHAFRTLRKNPGFTTVALLTLGLGIGTNTAMFSIVSAVLLRPLPYPDSARLVELNQSHLQDAVLASYGASGPNFKDWRSASRSFASMGIHEWASFWLGNGEQTQEVRGRRISADLLPTLGIQPLLGRGFLPDDEKSGGVALVGHELWQRQLGGDTNVVGRTIRLNDQPHTVIGVMPPGLVFPARPEVWVPLTETSDLMRQRDNHLGGVIARLKPGVGLRQAQAEMDVIARQLAEQYPTENKDWGIRVASWHGKMIEGIRPVLPIMASVTGFVLLIACANLSNLLLARATVRHKELAIRAALGARRWRLVRQVLAESLVLALAGGAVGLAAVLASRKILAALVSPHLPRFALIQIDGTVWLFALLAAVLTGLLCGLVPGWRITRSDLKSDTPRGRSAQLGRPHRIVAAFHLGRVGNHTDHGPADRCGTGVAQRVSLAARGIGRRSGEGACFRGDAA